MKQYLDILKKSKLFLGLDDEEILSALNCFNATVKNYPKDAYVFSDGDEVTFIGMILEGEIQAQKTDYDGNENIISKLYSSDIIAASACYSSEKRLPFDMKCLCSCRVICLNSQKLIRPCQNACQFHTLIIRNMLNIVSDRNIVLAAKINILTKRTIKEKILSYLLSQSKKAGSKKFSIPLSRRQMAEYLSTNRSALSRELCALRDQNLLTFKGNIFTLKT